LDAVIENPKEHTPLDSASRFNSTHWSVVLSAGSEASPASREALEKLCRAYWRPLQAFARRLGHSEHDAQDLTQGFFAHFLEKGYIRVADPERGRFRTFLLSSFQHFIQAEWIKARAAKRGGGHPLLSLDELSVAEQESVPQPVNEAAANAVFDRQWASEVFSLAIARLKNEFALAGKAGDFQELKCFLSQPGHKEAYALAANHLDTQPETIAVAVHRLRRRYGELLRAEIENTVSHADEVEDELRYLMEVISSTG
jgi:DNA-directed RNA polymerase specialized sigma24 family protein